jgi:hypothetical protein
MANTAEPTLGEYYVIGGCLPTIGRAFLFTRKLAGNRVFFSGWTPDRILKRNGA